MKALYLIWGLLVWQIAAWAFAPPLTPQQVPAGDGKAYGPDEDRTVAYRDELRQSTFRILAEPTGNLCTEQGRKAFIRGLGEYYYQRQNQMERYPEIHGQLGADYIARQWSGTDDRRIDRLTQEIYSKGYIKPEEFEGVARKRIVIVVKDERVLSRGCEG